MFKKGQSSVEYIFVVGLALLIIVPGTILVSQYATSSQDGITHNQVEKIGYDLLTTAELMYSVGDNSWKTVTVTFPERVDNLTIYNLTNTSELVITYDQGATQGVFFSDLVLLNSSASDCDLGCTIPLKEGPQDVRVEAKDGIIRFRVV